MAGWRPSQGNARDLHPIHPPHLQPHPPGWLLGFEDIGLLARMPLPHMRFLFVGPGLCLRLPSDSASRRTPLPSGYRFPPPGSEKDFHLQVTNQSPQLIGWRLRATRHAWRTKKNAPVKGAFSGSRYCSPLHLFFPLKCDYANHVPPVSLPLVSGGPTWVRTRDRPVMSRWLYQLSYGPLHFLIHEDRFAGHF